MVSATSMRRGAREANKESARLADRKVNEDMGRAIGQLVVFVREVQDLRRRVADLEKEVDYLRSRV